MHLLLCANQKPSVPPKVRAIQPSPPPPPPAVISGARRQDRRELQSIRMVITNRELLLIRLLFHVFLSYVWFPTSILSTIQVYVAYMRRVLPSSILELQVILQSANVILNHRITAACTEDTTWQWMQHIVIAPNGTYAIFLTSGGGADNDCIYNC